jgi:hypothetical protein
LPCRIELDIHPKIFTSRDIGGLHTRRPEAEIGLIANDLGSLNPAEQRKSRVGLARCPRQ